jgi:hypothetical protein
MYLVAGRRVNRYHLKRRLLAAGLKDERCESCGISEWLGAPLSMALHHINGDGNDNRLENLQLRPNCHAQTPNFSGKNRGAARRRATRRALGEAGLVPLEVGSMRKLPMIGEAA